MAHCFKSIHNKPIVVILNKFLKFFDVSDRIEIILDMVIYR